MIALDDSTRLIGGVDARSLASEFGTPLYVYDYDTMETNIATVEQMFLQKYPNSKAYFAAKSFWNLPMARIIRRSKLGVDVASQGECFIALKAGIQPERILYHGNNKSFTELQYAIEHGVGRIVVDSLREWDDIETIAQSLDKTVKVFVRFSPKLHHVPTHKNIQTGHKSSKFGVDLDRHLGDLVTRIQSASHVKFVGFHFHVGSQLFTNQAHVEAVDEVFLHMDHLRKRYDIVCSELDIGGGFAIPYLSNQQAISLGDFLDPILQRIQDTCQTLSYPTPAIAIEPGRFIVGPAGVTLYTVGTVKTSNGTNYLAIDGGMTDNLRVALYQATYEAINLSKNPETTITTYTIVGNACESTDVMIPSQELPETTPGDVLAIPNTGAYEHSLANNFNKMLRPAVVLIVNQKPILLQRRETLEDLIQRDGSFGQEEDHD